MRILVVEDDLPLADVIARGLRGAQLVARWLLPRLSAIATAR